MATKRTKTALFSFLLFVTAQVNAASITTYQLEGRLTHVDTPVDSVHSLGDAISLRLKLDREVLDTNTSVLIGNFTGAIRGLDVTINGDTVSSTGPFDLYISNGSAGNSISDSISFSGNLERTPGFLGSDPASIWVGLLDSTQTLLASDGIPDLAALLLSNWGGVVDTGADINSSVSIDFLIDSVHVVPIPAAAWLFISGLIGLFGYKRYKAE